MDMDIRLLVDFGSTYTKILAVDLDREVLLGRTQALTTVDSDITIGLRRAYSTLIDECGIDERHIRGRYASSSAAGGLRIAAIGLVPALTLEAARRAALGAGAKVVCAYGFEIDETIVGEVEAASCDIILLTGGTDGGDKAVILHNARMLANSTLTCPILVAGNRVVSGQVREILEAKGKAVSVTSNVLPRLDAVEVEPAQALIRDIFIARIIEAKGLAGAREFVGGEILPTPKATLQAAALLADGTDDEPGIGSLVIVEVGGATTNIHSVSVGSPSDPQTIVKGLPEPRVKRTVEGDLGIRYNAPTIHGLVGDGPCHARLRAIHPSLEEGSIDLKAHVRALAANVGYVPSSTLEYAVDVMLAESATSVAMQRHAGTLREEFSVVGAIKVQYGKDLLDVENLIGTGGIFKYDLHPERILRAARFSANTPWSLMPKAPKAFIDSEYFLYGAGLLAGHFPTQALRIAKKYLRPTRLDE
jgi:uncharacterized protein (TIGR01319 family)